MVSVQSGLCSDDASGNNVPSRILLQSSGNSTMLCQQPCNGESPRNWRFISHGNVYLSIENQSATTSSSVRSAVIDVYIGQVIQVCKCRSTMQTE
jgi:hypothetical protein